MDNQQKLSLFRAHLPGEEVQDGLLSSLLEDAAALICALTWRKEVPPELENAQVRLAVIFYNRMGMEGENAHQEGRIFGYRVGGRADDDDVQRGVACGFDDDPHSAGGGGSGNLEGEDCRGSAPSARDVA